MPFRALTVIWTGRIPAIVGIHIVFYCEQPKLQRRVCVSPATHAVSLNQATILMRSDKISPGSSAGARLFSPHGEKCTLLCREKKRGKKTQGQDSRWGLWGRQAPREHGCVREAIIGNILISAAGLCNSHVTHQWRDITACPTLVFTQSFTNLPVRCTKAVPLSVYPCDCLAFTITGEEKGSQTVAMPLCACARVCVFVLCEE